jgi:hypothetical protein
LHNENRSIIGGRVRGIVHSDGASHALPAQTQPAVSSERSGARLQLDPSFRRVTLVSAHQSSLRRSGSLLP